MTPELTDAFVTIQSKLITYYQEHPAEDMHETLKALQVLKRNLETLPAVVAIYHEGIERLGSQCDVEA